MISLYNLKTLLDNQMSSMNCRMFSTEYSFSDLGGKGMKVMLDGINGLSRAVYYNLRDD